MKQRPRRQATLRSADVFQTALRRGSSFAATIWRVAAVIVCLGACVHPRLAIGAQESGACESLLPMLQRYPDAFRDVLADAEELRLQVLVSEVVRAPRTLRLQTTGYRVDAEYFYPASAIKIVAAIAAIEELRAHGLEQPMEAVVTVYEHTSSLRRLLQKMLVISSNDAFNTLFDVAGHEALHRTMWDAGLSSARLHHRLHSGSSIEANRRSPAISVSTKAGESLTIEPRRSDLDLPPHSSPSTLVGRAFERDGERVDRPMDFSTKNGLSLRDHHHALIGLIHPTLLQDQGFALTDAERNELTEIMAASPPAVDLEGDEHRFKPLLPGLLRLAPRERFRYVNKAGRAYGFHIENAYVEDLETGRAFFVTAVIYVNENGVLNDNRYQYKAISYPFMADLGEVLGREVLLLQEP